MPAGRPTSYRTDYADEAVAFMAKGFSATAFAGHIRVSRDTLYEWAKKFPEFADALKVGQAARTEVLEGELLQADLPGPQITARIFALKNAAPLDWRDRHEVTGADGGPLAVSVVRFGETSEGEK